MDKSKIFHMIDMQTWPMAQSFYYYTQMAPTTYTVNVTIDVTILRNTLKGEGYKIFPAYLYLVTKAISKQQEMRIGLQDGVLGYWDYLTPVYPQFQEDDKTTSLLWTEFDEHFEIFYRHYIEDTAQHGNSHGILSTKGVPLPNASFRYSPSCNNRWLPLKSVF